MCPVYVNGVSTSGFDATSNQPITGAWSFSQALTTAAINASGNVSVGDDVQITAGAGQFSTTAVNGGLFVTGLSSVNDLWLRAKKATDTDYRLQAYGSGKLEWGDGSSAPDTSLRRSATGTLQTNDAFKVGGSFEVFGNSVLCAAAATVGFYGSAGITQHAAIADAAGGVVIDVEARAALNTVLATLRTSTGVALIAG